MTDADEVEYRARLQRALGPDFVLGDLIGRGGFGSVYAAVDRRLERDVAIKALRHDMFPTRLVLERFENEAKAVARLRHPNILPVYAVGEGEGLAYMIMPVIRGSNLKSLLASGHRIETATTIRIIGEIARALGAAHRLGIVHRDVKPENILLDGDDHHALLADFGIAKSAEADAALTGSGVILGSPHYMSPEQAAAEKVLDGRSDIYSLGAVAYEMLAGRRPFESTNYQQLLVLQFTTEPRSLRDVAPDIPGAVADTIMRALERDPAHRWQSAGEFATALATAGAPPPALGRTEPSWFARRGLVFAILYFVGLWSMLIAMPLIDAASAVDNKGMQLAISLLRTPLQLIVLIVELYLVAELGMIVWRLRRSGLAWPAVRHRLFFQPSWWQAWYPRVLRDPSNVWDRMTWGMRVMRTLTWLSIPAGLFAIPIFAVVPLLATLAQGLALELPLALRVTIEAAGALKWPLRVALLVIVAGVPLQAAVSRVSPATVFRLLFTWRAEAWNTPAGRRLQRGAGAST